MDPEGRAASVAFTYAWWLTGDDRAAEDAVTRALAVVPSGGAGEEQRTALLSAVRREAAPVRTMCPASEVALLHDGQEVPLDEAAQLAEVEPAEARVELAHGRLEALLETIRDPFTHPERLGGLAVNNPPDVAHARQCEDCARARDLLRRGRQELCALPLIPAPAAVVALLQGGDDARASAAVTGPVRVSRGREGEHEEHGEVHAQTESALAPAALDQDPTDTSDDAPALETSAEPSEEPATPRTPSTRSVGAKETVPRRGTAVAAGALVLGVLVLGATALTGGDAPADEDTALGPATTGQNDPAVEVLNDTLGPEQGPVDPVGEPDPPPGPAEGDAEPWPTVAPAGGFSVHGATLLGPDGEPTAALEPDHAVRVALAYAGADEAAPIQAQLAGPGLDPQPLLAQVVGAGTHVLVWPAPPAGWPPGRHQVTITSDGEVVALVDLTIA